MKWWTWTTKIFITVGIIAIAISIFFFFLGVDEEKGLVEYKNITPALLASGFILFFSGIGILVFLIKPIKQESKDIE